MLVNKTYLTLTSALTGLIEVQIEAGCVVENVQIIQKGWVI